MATNDDFTIRPLRQEDARLPVEWAAGEGWNPGLHDAGSFFAADPQGFLVGMVGEEHVATISVVRYGTSFGFLGLYIVRTLFRGRGHGLRIWNAGMAHLARGHFAAGSHLRGDELRTGLTTRASPTSGRWVCQLGFTTVSVSRKSASAIGRLASFSGSA